MHDSPPPYPGINPTYPNQPNGFTAPQQSPHMGFQGNPGMPPSYPQAPGTAAGGFQQASGGYPAAPGPSYPTLPANGFMPGPSAPPSSSKSFIHFSTNVSQRLTSISSDKGTRSSFVGLLRPPSPELGFRPAASVLRKSSSVLRVGSQEAAVEN